MKIYSNTNVYDKALERIERIFNEFANVVVAFSGGKDSTVVFELSLIIARKLNRLPLRVMFVDQEAEWESTIEMVDYAMRHKDVIPMWYQMPILLSNATSTTEEYLKCWHPEDEHRWMRERADISIKENKYGCIRFKAMFDAIMKVEFPDSPACLIGGVRTEESPQRFHGMTQSLTYKDMTWGKKLDTGKHKHFTFYPIYDWAFTDVWAAIYKNNWKYSKHYDNLYRLGIGTRQMRVSNVHHETAVNSLWIMQEIEPKTYERLTQRLSGVDMASKFGEDDYFVHKLPTMFSCWMEYRDHLLDKLVTNPKWKAIFSGIFQHHDKNYHIFQDMLVKVHVQSILTNDWELVKIKNFLIKPLKHEWQRIERPKLTKGMSEKYKEEVEIEA